MRREESGQPLRIAIAADAPVVVAGVKSLLGTGVEGMVVVDLSTADPAHDVIDLVLYDPVNGVPGAVVDTAPPSRPVLVGFSWSVGSETAALCRRHGARGLLAKDLTAPELRAAIRTIHAGDPIDYVVMPAAITGEAVTWPQGLTPREAEILHLITQGLSNDEIAGRLFLSINSIKTYVRTAYRKIGVTRRAQAVLWGVHHGFDRQQAPAVHRP